MSATDPPPRGVLDSVRAVLSAGCALFQNRAELFAVETREETARLVQWLVWVAVIVFLGAMALALATVAVIVAFWDTARMNVLIGLTLLYGVAAVAGFFVLRNRIRKCPPPFAETISELKKDRQCFNSHP
ncbi:MAG: phage holin family protein [Verrucomicrobiota bacterium]|nr:phage holin family protein [Verrucomicrobiota bacterium]